MIGPTLPQRIVAIHSMIADERVHQCLLKGMAHVQAASNVRWWQHDAIGLAATSWCKVTIAFPVVATFFYGLGVVGFFHV